MSSRDLDCSKTVNPPIPEAIAPLALSKIVRVLVEWNRVSEQEIYRKYALEQMTSNLAKLPRVEHRSEEIQALPCLGMVSKSGMTDVSTEYGLPFKVPNVTIKTLIEVLHKGALMEQQS